MNHPPRAARIVPLSEGARVTPVELFLDLVFVYGFTQITELIAHEDSVLGLGNGLVMLGLVWWLWVGFSWVGNVVAADQGPVRIVLFAVMALVFIIDVTIPEAFHDLPGGLWGPWVFAVAYLMVQLIHVGVMLYASRGVPSIRRNSLLMLIPASIGFGLLMWAGSVSGGPAFGLFALALAVNVGAVFMIDAQGWELRAASHFAERHGLIIIVALGESIVSIGVGVSQLASSWPVIVACLLGIVLSATLWWAYFDVVAIIAEDVLHHTPAKDRARLARDSYTYLHLPMIAGIILMSLGLKKVFAHLADPLTTWGAIVLYGGVSLYLLAHVAFRLRNIGSWNVQRAIVAVGLLGLIPVVTRMPALGGLALLSAIMVGLILYEMNRFAQVRQRIRAGDTSARP